MPAEPTCYGLKKVFVNEKEELNKVNGAGWGIVGFKRGRQLHLEIPSAEWRTPSSPTRYFFLSTGEPLGLQYDWDGLPWCL